MPRYACFVAEPKEASREFVAQVHRLTRRLNEDPYTDCFWGILTGYDATNALHIVRQTKPLTICKVASGTTLAMDMIQEGVCYSELEKNWMMKKEKGVRRKC
jgi:zinc protease